MILASNGQRRTGPFMALGWGIHACPPPFVAVPRASADLLLLSADVRPWPACERSGH